MPPTSDFFHYFHWHLVQTTELSCLAYYNNYPPISPCPFITSTVSIVRKVLSGQSSDLVWFFCSDSWVVLHLVQTYSQKPSTVWSSAPFWLQLPHGPSVSLPTITGLLQTSKMLSTRTHHSVCTYSFCWKCSVATGHHASRTQGTHISIQPALHHPCPPVSPFSPLLTDSFACLHTT